MAANSERIRKHQNWLAWAALSLEEATDERIDRVIEARAAGLTWQQIGEALGITKEAAANLHRRHTEGKTK